MVTLKEVAVTVREIRAPGACGFGLDVRLVPYGFAQDRLEEYQIANKILLEENEKWAKELCTLRTENERLRKGGK